MLRVRYVGTGSGVTIPGVGEVQPGGVIDVPDEVGRRLVERPDFEEMYELRSVSLPSASIEYTSASSSTDITVTTTVTDQTEQTEEVKEE